MWGMAIAFWEAVFRWSTIGAFVLGGLTVTCAFISAWVGYELTDLTQQEASKQILEAQTRGDEARAEASRATESAAKANERIAELNRETGRLSAQAETARAAIAGADASAAKANAEVEKAKAEVAKATEAIAKANERAASLEKDAAQARLEQEHLKQQLAWRTISPEVGTKIRNRLAAEAHTIILAWISNDPEATFLAIQFSKILADAKWTIVATQSRTYSDRVLFGISVPGPDNSATTLFRSALTDVGIPFSTEQVPAAPMMLGSSAEADMTLMIASKVPPI